MTTRKEHVRQGLALEETEDGWIGTRTIDVEIAAGDGLDALFRTSSASIIPEIGDELRGGPRGLRVVGRQFAILGTVCRATIRYATPSRTRGGADDLGATEISVAAETISEDSIYDIDGNLMITRFAGYTFRGYETSRQIHRVTIERPTVALEITRVERINAFGKALEFSGRTNEDPWQGRDPEQWLMRISSTQISSDTHRVTYSAVFNPATWRAEIRHTVQGRVPPEVRPTNGVEFRPVFNTAPFSRLSLPRYV